jgi:flagellar hook assembly protein FlgD
MTACLLFKENKVIAQTSGTLTFSVTTTEPSGGYTNKFVLAVWIRDNAGNFVKTKIKYANARVQYLNVWVSNSGSNVVDAATGSTRTAHQTFTISWNATNVSAAVVPDGVYQVWMQMADQNVNGPTNSITFTKGTSAVHLTPVNSGNFTNLVLDWAPLGVGIDENKTNNVFSITPNPVNSKSIIKYTLNQTEDVTISLYDINGKLVNVLCDRNQTAGIYSLPISVKVKPGIYFVKMYTGRTQHVEKVLITE